MKKFFIILLAIFIALIPTQFLNTDKFKIIDGKQIKLVKFSNKYIKGEYIGYVFLGVDGSKYEVSRDFPDSDVKCSYPLIIQNQRLILVNDVTLQRELFSISLPGETVSYMVKNPGDEDNRIFLVCKTKNINKLIALNVSVKQDDKYLYRPPDKFKAIFEINTACNKIIACEDKRYKDQEVIICQSGDKKTLFFYSLDGYPLGTRSFNKPTIIYSQYANKQYDSTQLFDYCYDGSFLYKYNKHTDVPFTKIEKYYPVDLKKPLQGDLFDEYNTYLSIWQFESPTLIGKETLHSFAFGKHYENKLKVIDKIYHGYYCQTACGIFFLNTYFDHQTCDQILSMNGRIKCLGGSDLPWPSVYYNVYGNHNNKLLNISAQDDNKFEITTSDYTEEPYISYLPGYCFDLINKRGLSLVECFFTENEVYIKQ